jgi:hypothetical protein
MKTIIVVLSFFYIFQNPSEYIIIGTWNTLENNTKIQISFIIILLRFIKIVRLVFNLLYSPIAQS